MLVNRRQNREKKLKTLLFEFSVSKNIRVCLKYVIILVVSVLFPIGVSAQTFTYTDTPSGGIVINGGTPCSNPVVRNLNVSDSFVIADARFGFNASHSWRNDIRLIVQHPDGTRVTLIAGQVTFSNRKRNYDLELTDASTNPIDDGNNDNVNAPFYDRSATPSNALSAFDGKNSNGTWRIEVCDLYAPLDNGRYRRARLTLDAVVPPSVGLVKTCILPANCSTTPQLPDTELTYQIDFTNTGGRSAGSLVLVDSIPGETDFKLGSASVNTGSTGLTFVIEYSSDYDIGNPTAATWNHIPASGGGGADTGFDRDVKAIRWRVTSGSLSQIAPNNTGSLSFAVKIR